jgi:hypothetical protein
VNAAGCTRDLFAHWRGEGRGRGARGEGRGARGEGRGARGEGRGARGEGESARRTRDWHILGRPRQGGHRQVALLGLAHARLEALEGGLEGGKHLVRVRVRARARVSA